MTVVGSLVQKILDSCLSSIFKAFSYNSGWQLDTKVLLIINKLSSVIRQSGPTSPIVLATLALNLRGEGHHWQPNKLHVLHCNI